VAHAADLADNDFFSHDSQDGRDFADRVRAAGHPAPGGENIAKGQRSAAEVVAAWMNSAGHRRKTSAGRPAKPAGRRGLRFTP